MRKCGVSERRLLAIVWEDRLRRVLISTISRRRNPSHARVWKVRVCRMTASVPIVLFTCVSASAIVGALNV